MASTLVLTRADLVRCVDRVGLMGEIEDASARYRQDAIHPAQRVRARPSGAVTAMVLMPGLAPGVAAYTVKVHAKNPARRPALSGVICLHDLASGDLLAVMDSGWLTAVRTAAAAAIATDRLAVPAAGAVGVIGAGAQGRAMLRCLALLREVLAVRVHDVDPGAARELAAWASEKLGVGAEVCPDPGAVAARSEIVLVATWARTAVLGAADVRPGTHITSVGADEAGKVELAADLLAEALVVTDDRALAAGVDADASLAEVLSGQHPGRTTTEQVSVYSPVGLPMLDCVAAWHAYRSAQHLGLGAAHAMER